MASKLLTKLGVTDLAMVSADRAASASLESESSVAKALSAYQVVCALLRADRTDDAEHLAVTMAAEVEGRVRSDDPAMLSVGGALWLIAAVISARRTERFEAYERLDRAERLAQLLGEDGNHLWTAFGPTNVALHRVSVAAELGDAAEALQAATNIRVERLPVGLKSRRAQMHLDLAWAQAQRKRDALGLADTYALGVLCEAIALKRKTIAVPFIGERFWGHPALQRSLSELSSAVSIVDPRGDEFEELGPVPSGAGESVAAAFDPKRLVVALSD